MRVILTTGGTGGHVFPALAVAEALKARFPGCGLLFAGGLYGREAEWAAQAGIDFVGFPVRGISGRGVRSLAAMGAMLSAIGKAREIVRDFRPDVIAGFGGYAAFPVMTAGYMAGVPLLLHEQNAGPGLANRILGKFARTVCVSMPEGADSFDRKKTVVTGNPVRESIAGLGAKHREKTFDGRRLLILGGSLGARALNTAVTSMLEGLAAAGAHIRHQTGPADFERVQALYREAGVADAVVEPFISDMAQAYEWADLAVCRAGATTIAELAACGVPAFFVPFPHAARNHQAANAAAVARAGAAVMMEERDIAGDGNAEFARRVCALLTAPQTLRTMGAAARGLAKPQAAATVAAAIGSLAKGADGSA